MVKLINSLTILSLTLSANQKAMSDYFSPHSESIYGMSISIESNFSISNLDEIGVFTKDEDNFILVGSFKFESKDIEKAKVDFMLYEDSTNDSSDGKDGAINGDLLYFKLYDNSKDRVFELTPLENVTFQSGSFASPKFKSVTLNLDESTPVESSSPLLLSNSEIELNIDSESSSITISGGVKPYSIERDSYLFNLNIVESTLSIEPKAIGVTEIKIFDSLGSSATLKISIVADKFSISDNSLEFDLSHIENQTLNISGGLTPYNIKIEDKYIADAILDGDSLKVIPKGVGATFIDVEDALGSKEIVTVIVKNLETQLSSDNTPPKLEYINLSSNIIKESEEAMVTLLGVDADRDELRYSCQASNGTLTKVEESTFKFIAPEVESDENIDISCYATDGVDISQALTAILVKDIESKIEPISITLNSGWNLLSPPVDSNIFPISTISNLEYGWSFDNLTQSWSKFFGNSNIYVERGDGFWGYIDEGGGEVNFTKERVESEFKAQSLTLKSNSWNLIGLPYQFNSSELFNSLNIESGYIYIDNSWISLTPNNSTQIPLGSGVWIKSR